MDGLCDELAGVVSLAVPTVSEMLLFSASLVNFSLERNHSQAVKFWGPLTKAGFFFHYSTRLGQSQIVDNLPSFGIHTQAS